MKIIFRLLPVILCFTMLAAHFSRAGLFPFVVLSLGIPFLLFIRKPWVARIIQAFLLLGAIEWIRAMMGYIEIRKTTGDDWARLAIILISVSLLTVLSGLVFRGKLLKKRYRLDKPQS
jgi:hypothetical protein